MAKAPRSPINVATVQHKGARRRNNPTMELQSFLADDEASPTEVTFPRRYSPATHPELYERNKALDPQLVWADTEDGEGAVQLTWRGKDEQDEEPLRVDAVPIYTAEKIHPKAIIDDIRRRAASGAGGSLDDQPDLFADFNGIDEDDRLEFYQHTMKWTNRMILGDSLQVMASLAEKEDLRGKVQAIYFDPPYGIKFGSNWQVSTNSRDVKDGKSDAISREPEQVKAFRDTWQDGIHSYLSYLRDRILAMHDLLTESGSVFVQIGDENVHLVRSVLDEVFGAENVVSQITFQTTTGRANSTLAAASNFILWFAKDIERIKVRPPLQPKSMGLSTDEVYKQVRRPDGSWYRLGSGGREAPLDGERIFAPDNITSSRTAGDGDLKSFTFEGKSYPSGKGTFKTDRLGLERLGKAQRIWKASNSLRYVRYLNDFDAIPISNVWTDTQTGSFTEDKLYVCRFPLRFDPGFSSRSDPGCW